MTSMLQSFAGAFLGGAVLSRPGCALALAAGVAAGVYCEQNYRVPDVQAEVVRCGSCARARAQQALLCTSCADAHARAPPPSSPPSHLHRASRALYALATQPEEQRAWAEWARARERELRKN